MKRSVSLRGAVTVAKATKLVINTATNAHPNHRGESRIFGMF
jgi:hypothetical protein